MIHLLRNRRRPYDGGLPAAQAATAAAIVSFNEAEKMRHAGRDWAPHAQLLYVRAHALLAFAQAGIDPRKHA